jgi:hypothetical protein
MLRRYWYDAGRCLPTLTILLVTLALLTDLLVP